MLKDWSVRLAKLVCTICTILSTVIDCLFIAEISKAAAEEKDLQIEIGRRANRTELLLFGVN